MPEFAVSYSPLSHNIYAGRLDKDGAVFRDKTRVTNQAVGAVAEFLADNDGSAEMTHKDTGARYRVSVEILEKEADNDES